MNSTANAAVNGKPPRYTQGGAIFIPVSLGPNDPTPNDILAWIRSLQPQHDGRIYIRVTDVRAAFGEPDLFYNVVSNLSRQGMAEVERWRLEKLGHEKAKAWDQMALIYVLKPINMDRQIAFECYTKQPPKKPLTREERLEIWAVHGGICVYCNEPVPIEDMAVDHQTPRSRGGSDDPDNLVCSCHPCNMSKHARTAEEYRSLISKRSGA